MKVMTSAIAITMENRFYHSVLKRNIYIYIYTQTSFLMRKLPLLTV